MIAKSLRCVNFRNIKDETLTPQPGVNVLFGDNAQGKTNLIEALWLFTGARSFRGSRDPEFIGFGGEFSRLELGFSARGRDNFAAVTFSSAKKAELNGVKLDGVSAFMGQFCAVVFSPDHLDLVKEGPAGRRRFLDTAVTQLLPRYAAAAAEYRELLRQRNALLKDIPGHSELLDTLEVWDERLARTGAYLVLMRLRYLVRLRGRAAAVYSGLAQEGKGEELSLSYEPAGGPDYPADVSDARAAAEKLRKSLAELLRTQRQGDLECGYTRAGPHRDDLRVTVAGLDARIYGSQGQQRSAVLALKLAEAEVLRESVGEPPVLLLDDVMSELDRHRQNYILNHIGGCQVFITCCDPAGLEGLTDGGVYRVSGGKIEPA